MVGIEALEMLNLFHFFEQNEQYNSYQRDDQSLPLDYHTWAQNCPDCKIPLENLKQKSLSIIQAQKLCSLWQTIKIAIYLTQFLPPAFMYIKEISVIHKLVTSFMR